MEIVAGVDGCRGGWIAVSLDDSARVLAADVFATATALAEGVGDARVVAIDIPIGLTEAGPRDCEVEARRLLGRPRSSSVFAAPLRGMLAAATYREACAYRLRIDDKSVSKQAYNIFPKVREIDTLLQSSRAARARFFEVHPELSFRALNGGRSMLHRKSNQAGKAERKELLDRIFGGSAIDAIRRAWPRSQVADDDIHDALAVAWSAIRIARGEAVTLPATPPLDCLGFPMRIVF